MKNHICFICDEEYVLPTVVAIASLKRHIDKTSGQEYICYVFSFALSDTSNSQLYDLSEPGFSVRVQIVGSECHREQLDQVTQRTHVTKVLCLNSSCQISCRKLKSFSIWIRI